MNMDDKIKNYNKLMKQVRGKPSAGKPTPQHKLDRIESLTLAGKSSKYICRKVHVTNATVSRVRQGMQ